MEDKIDLILYKLKDLQKELAEVKATVESHRVEHGFEKMKPGGVNRQFGGDQEMTQGPPGMPPGMGSGGGMDFGYGMPGSGMPIDDPSMPPI
mgnify:CR=1 FL=1|tara:strand:+ start:770 stop:1045 length:276 start_codon:yes stop_codon:yes gene_type:complete